MKKNLFLIVSVVLVAIISLLGFRLLFPNITTTAQSSSGQSSGAMVDGNDRNGDSATTSENSLENINKKLLELLMEQLANMSPEARQQLLDHMKDAVSDLNSMKDLLTQEGNIPADAAGEIIDEMQNMDQGDLKELIDTLADMAPGELEQIIQDMTEPEMSMSPSPT